MNGVAPEAKSATLRWIHPSAAPRQILVQTDRVAPFQTAAGGRSIADHVQTRPAKSVSAIPTAHAMAALMCGVRTTLPGRSAPRADRSAVAAPAARRPKRASTVRVVPPAEHARPGSVGAFLMVAAVRFPVPVIQIAIAAGPPARTLRPILGIAASAAMPALGDWCARTAAASVRPGGRYAEDGVLPARLLEP
jgi:hypothetical protein